MAKTLHISINNKIATYNQRDGGLVCGNNDYQIEFTFDSEWDDLPTKTARFIWNGQYEDVVFTGTTCTVPVVNQTRRVAVGVYAGNLSTTTPAYIEAKESILCGNPTHNIPRKDVYNQIIELLESMGGGSGSGLTKDEQQKLNALTIDGANWANQIKGFSDDGLQDEYVARVAWVKDAIKDSFATVAGRWVKVTATRDGSTVTLDHTYREMKSYITDGFVPYVICDDAIYVPIGIDEYGASFVCVSDVYLETISSFDEGATWEWERKELALKSQIPKQLPNPNALTFTGAVTGTYDGSKAVEINIPEGGSGSDIDAITNLYADAMGILQATYSKSGLKPVKDVDGDSVKIPETLPNPKALTFTGAVSAAYDGSKGVSVEIPTINTIVEAVYAKVADGNEVSY